MAEPNTRDIDWAKVAKLLREIESMAKRAKYDPVPLSPTEVHLMVTAALRLIEEP